MEYEPEPEPAVAVKRPIDMTTEPEPASRRYAVLLRRICAINTAQWLAQIGHWMQKNGPAIRRIQWGVVVIYGILVLLPACLPLPDQTAHLWNHLTLFSQFVFWGLWWPFVLLSIVFLGRFWCGILCPEGVLSEFASKHGRGRAIPRWMRWGGWPFVAFALTTIYGQMVSVYQYPKATLLVLGGSTVAAIAIGLIYGQEKRVWCKYLCPVNGVFALLARLAPFHYRVNEQAWRDTYTQTGREQRVVPINSINCAPLVPLRHMKGAAPCHMCARCSGHRNAITLSARSPSDEVVALGEKYANGWDTLLILYGMFGIAVGAFHWSVSPWFVAIKQAIAGWLVDRNIFWPLDLDAHVPWFLLTHYPEQNDVFSWLDGGLLIAYILATGLVYGTALLTLLAMAARCLSLGLGEGLHTWRTARLHHLAQALIPLAGCGVFIGLSATTLTMLRAEHLDVSGANSIRLALLVGANVWSAWLAWRVTGQHTRAVQARLMAMICVIAAMAVADSAWGWMFWWW